VVAADGFHFYEMAFKPELVLVEVGRCIRAAPVVQIEKPSLEVQINGAGVHSDRGEVLERLRFFWKVRVVGHQP
jgi:hypothetical protein